MRISDWSSDVCSSDLIEIGDDDGQPGAVECGHKHCVERLRPASVRHYTLLTADSTVITGSRSCLHQAAETLRHASHGPFPSSFQGFPTRRSEEHTSELQSLMRISYAVFCLKKTKKHPTHTIKTTQHHCKS